MAKFTIALFPQGERVKIVGPASPAVAQAWIGKTGTVRDWRHIGPAATDPSHIIDLDDPVITPPQLVGERVKEPEHRQSVVEVPGSALESL
jgi:hypothetical protein